MQKTIDSLNKKVADLEKRVLALEKANEPPDFGDPKEDEITLAQAIELTKPINMISASFLQTRLSIGYTKASRILDQLEKLGLIGPEDGSKPRKVLK